MTPKTKIKFKRVCMLSTHGHFDPVPQLGQTDTGGQVVYVLQLARAISRNGIKVDIYTRWFDYKKKQVEDVPDTNGVRVIRIAAGPEEFIPKEEIYEVLPELSQNMVNFIKENKLEYDLFHGHYVDAGMVTLDVAKALNKPAFFTPHSLGAWKREQMGGDPAEMEAQY
ncbi:MAG: glycosyltransferase, partial [Candidatus Margulisbacteria bacterium]|nr:glycosyltransferase [Candidatus Margulisiibacteriota bacterium]